MIGTAPRKPTQEMNTRSRHGKWKGSSETNTASGRATKMRKSAITSAGTATGASSAGVASRPSMRNMPIWDSHASPSCTRRMFSSACTCRLPITTPAR